MESNVVVSQGLSCYTNHIYLTVLPESKSCCRLMHLNLAAVNVKTATGSQMHFVLLETFIQWVLTEAIIGKRSFVSSSGQPVFRKNRAKKLAFIHFKIRKNRILKIMLFFAHVCILPPKLRFMGVLIP